MGSALLVIDMQNGFCHPEGSLPVLQGALSRVEDCISNTASAVSEARSAGVPVLFTRQAYRPGRADVGPNLRLRHPGLDEVDGLADGSWDAEILDELDRRPEDPVVAKNRFDAFLDTPLDALLRGLGVDELVVAGVVTNLCVESTVRGAYMRDYSVTVLADCCASVSPRMHELGIEVMGGMKFARIATVARFDFSPALAPR
ncbi:cysteine hydrolase family protein [Pseudonocardia spinosispora]|uniref:cysteine hydrolase family protein n=1 Tax=Pseudonocardia spinosispora TaxID=103441 RepID=UPI0004261703|nr:isochorismatase family cysteine hydrolase [Pseudonocardia spinosispora]